MNKTVKTVLAILLAQIVIFGAYAFVSRPKLADVINQEDAVCGQGEGCTISKKRYIGYNVGDQLPNLELTTIDGKTEYLYDLLKGKEKFVLSLAADWCSDCERQDQKLEQYYSKLPSNYGAAVIFVDYSSSDGSKTTSKEQVETYLNEKNYSFPTYWDEGNVIADNFGGVLATPTNIVLDENAIIKAKSEEIDMDILFETNDEDFDKSILKA